MSDGPRATVEIISIGDELLRGIVQETNAYWLSLRIAARGAVLRRVTLLPDEPPVVATELKAAIARAPTLIVTHGGLGPTEDDRTREALALALDAPLERDERAHRIVEGRYAELARDGAVADAALDDARMRMALLPRGADALENQVGAAPAVLVRPVGTVVVALPGVPSELTWIWEHSLAPTLDQLLGPGGFAERTFVLELRDESRIAWLLKVVADEHAGVYVKSRAKGFGVDDLIRVTMHATGASDAEARARVDAAASDLRAAMSAEGIVVLD